MHIWLGSLMFLRVLVGCKGFLWAFPYPSDPFPAVVTAQVAHPIVSPALFIIINDMYADIFHGKIRIIEITWRIIHNIIWCSLSFCKLTCIGCVVVVNSRSLAVKHEGDKCIYGRCDDEKLDEGPLEIVVIHIPKLWSMFRIAIEQWHFQFQCEFRFKLSTEMILITFGGLPLSWDAGMDTKPYCLSTIGFHFMYPSISSRIHI